MQDYPLSMLGNLQLPDDQLKYSSISGIEFAGFSGNHAPLAESEALVNDVALPQHVIEELRQLGIPLSWFSKGELQDAVEACAYDRNLIDDAGGIHFRDKIKLSSGEKELSDGSTSRLHQTHHSLASRSFVDRLNDERESKPTIHQTNKRH